MVVTAETFERQLSFLKKHFHIVPLSFLLNSTLDTGHSTLLDRPLCVITFDDGWRDNYEIAFPILQKHGVPATIFLTSDFIGTKRAFWHTELIYALLHGELAQLRRTRHDLQAYPASISPHLIRLARLTRPPSVGDVDPFIEAMKHTCDEDTIQDMIQDLAAVLRVRKPFFPERRFFMDWDQVREIATAGIGIGSHGCSHRILTRLKPEEVEEELVRSKAEIEAHIGQEVQHLAYPDGAWNRALMALVAKAEYRTECLGVSGPDGVGYKPLALCRLGIAEAVSAGGDGSFSEASLALWLFRAPRTRLV
jgi:peptidoglycan/xylan/chitin deacetylase (PgdA/CDA1 family)